MEQGTPDPLNPAEETPQQAGDDQLEVEALTLDPAQQSLADALRVSFGILKYVMLLLVVVYFFSGTFSLEATETAVRLRAGKIVNDNIEEGTHFAMPFPLEQVIKVDSSDRTLQLDQSFWYQATAVNEMNKLNRSQGGGALDPSQGAWSMLTGDANIVHAKWTIGYSITDSDDYVTNIGDKETLEKLIHAVAEQSLVHSVARTLADDIIRGNPDTEAAKSLMNKKLGAMGAGVTVNTVRMSEFTVPLKVLRAFDAATSAESEKAEAILAAQQERAKILGEAAGEGADELLTLIEEYQNAIALGDADAVAELDTQLDQVFGTLRISDDGPALSGQVAKKINEASGYKAKLVARYQAEAEQFRNLKDQYSANPQYLLERLWEEAKAEILAGDIETFYLPRSELRLVINRDPDLAKERQKEELKKIDKSRHDLD